jgi:CBS domain-containing protein
MKPADSADPTQVSVHVRRVLDGDGQMHSENEVYCLVRGHSVAVADCEGCTDYGGAEIDLSRHRNYVLCRRLTPDTARAAGAARPAVLRRRFVDGGTPGERTPVCTIMTPDVWCAREDLELSILRGVLAQHGFSGVPVVDDGGRCVGVVSAADLVRTGDDGHTRVRDVMSRLTFVLPDNASVSQAAALMALEHVHRIPIVTDDGRVAGIVSSIDVLAWLARQDGYVVPR